MPSICFNSLEIVKFTFATSGKSGYRCTGAFLKKYRSPRAFWVPVK